MDPEIPQEQRGLISRQQTSPVVWTDSARGSLVRTEFEDSSLNLSHASSGELFFDSCGGLNSRGEPSYLELTVSEPGGILPEQTWRFSQPVVLIGRAANCDLRLPRREVSRLHAYLQMIDGRWMCVDLGSENGVRWPAGRQRYGWLDSDGEIVVGPYHIKTVSRGSGAGDSETLPAVLRRRDCPEVHLEFLNGKSAGPTFSSWKVHHRVTLIGASRPCELQLEDPSVAKIHASLVLTANGLWIVNLVGDERTRVDGRPVRLQRLETGNELGIGRFRFRVRHVSRQPVPPVQAYESQAVHQPADANSMPATGGAGISESFVLGLMSQLAAMQQQFMDHSQQQMLMTAQLVTAMRSPQPGLDEELARVQELTRELQMLRSQLTGDLALRSQQATEEVPNATPIGKVETAASPDLPMQTTSTVTPSVPPDVVEKPTPTVAEAEPTAIPLPTLPEPVAQATQAHPVPVSTGPNTAPPDKRERRTHNAVEMHAALIERMASLERERTSRWSRIIGALTGNRQ